MADSSGRQQQTENARRGTDGDGYQSFTETREGRPRSVHAPRKSARVPWIFALLVVTIIAGTGCSASTQKGPLHDSTMVDLLIELHLAVARAETTNEIPPNIRDSILTAYNVDSSTYAEAVTFYSERPERYAEVYSRVLDRLNSERMPLDIDPPDEVPAGAPPTRSAR